MCAASSRLSGHHRKKWRNLTRVQDLLRRELGGGKFRYRYVRHHLTHAASTFFASPYDEAAILSVDAAGEWATTMYARGQGNRIQILGEIPYPHSLGFAYGAITQHLGFRICCDEGKVMGLAPYGKPRHREFFRRIIRFDKDQPIDSGKGLVLDLDYFQHHLGQQIYGSPKLTEALGPPRAATDPLEDRHADIAYGIQERCEEVMMQMSEKIKEVTKSDRLCLAGGVSLNSVANGKILERGPFQDVWAQPAANDAGGALGAALFVAHVVHDQPRRFVMEHASFGPSFGDAELAHAAKRSGLPHARRASIARDVAKLIAAGKIVAWFQGRMEWGPRALGNRSILADPRRPDMKDVLNARVKHRESFRPFAPAVLQDRAADFFASGYPSPFMLLVSGVREARRSSVPAITHVDGTARVQTVTAEANPRFHELLREFDRLTGVPMLVNTSFNVMGQPIVCTPEQAIECFNGTGIDALALGSFLLWKAGDDPLAVLGEGREVMAGEV
ncbi:MAG: carbamoyltransferase C-terminal domain-containing protein [Acidobacteriota bacterium]